MTPTDEKLIERVLEVINHGHARGCPWLFNAAAPCTCGRLALGVQVEAAMREQALSTGPAHDAGLIEAVARVEAALNHEDTERFGNVFVGLVVREADLRLILQALAGDTKPPLKMLVTDDWLQRHVATDPDIDTEAGGGGKVAGAPGGSFEEGRRATLGDSAADMVRRLRTAVGYPPHVARSRNAEAADIIERQQSALATQSAQLARMVEALNRLERAISHYQALRTTNNGSATVSMEITDARLALDEAVLAARAISEVEK